MKRPDTQQSGSAQESGSGSGGGKDSKPASKDQHEPPPNEAGKGGEAKPQASGNEGKGAANQNRPTDNGSPATRQANDSGGTGKSAGNEAKPTASADGAKGTGGEAKPLSNADAVEDAKRAGVKVDIEAQQHKHAPEVRAAKGVTGKEVNSAHVAPTSALRDTQGYVRGDAVTATLSRDTHRAMDNQWKAACRDMVAAGRKDMTVRELYNEVSKAIRNTEGLTAQQKGTLESMLHKELYGSMGLKPDDTVRLPYSGSGGKGGADGDAPKPADPKATEPRTEPKGPAVNERGEVIGSKAEGATAKMERAEAAAAKGGPHGEAPKLPKGEGGLGKAIGGAADKILHGLGKIGGIFGAALDAKQAYDEGKEIVAREKPEMLKEGDKVPLTMNPNRYSPEFHVESGYSVEKTNGQVIYRDDHGNQVTRDRAINGSTGNKEDRDRIKNDGA
ncbi:MAG: hypothetical protein ACJ74O_02240 [Frankiaceae bacterium]